MPILHYVSSFEGTYYRKLQDTASSSFFSCCFTSSTFISADTTFYNFLELQSKLSEKRIFVMNFPFLMDSYSNPPQTNIQDLPKCHKCFLLSLPFT